MKRGFPESQPIQKSTELTQCSLDFTCYAVCDWLAAIAIKHHHLAALKSITCGCLGATQMIQSALNRALSNNSHTHKAEIAALLTHQNVYSISNTYQHQITWWDLPPSLIQTFSKIQGTTTKGIRQPQRGPRKPANNCPHIEGSNKGNAHSLPNSTTWKKLVNKNLPPGFLGFSPSPGATNVHNGGISWSNAHRRGHSHGRRDDATLFRSC